MTGPDVTRLAGWLHEETAAFAHMVKGGDMGARVPTCPEWDLRELVKHIGQAHRWAAALVASRSTEPLPLDEVTVPATAADRTGWLLEGAERLIDEVEKAPPAPMWSFLGPRPPAFWLRRMLADTTVHRADAAFTVDGTYEIPPALATDTVSEGLEMLAAPEIATLNPKLAALHGDGETLSLLPADPGLDGWLITRAPGGVRFERRRDEGQVTLHAQVTDLLLVVTRRRPTDDPRVKVTGDAELLRHWLEHTAFG